MTIRHRFMVMFVVTALAVMCAEATAYAQPAPRGRPRRPVVTAPQPTRPTSTAPHGCVPGAQSQCACPGGSLSVQVCDADGTRLLPCQCAAPTGVTATAASSTTTPAAHDPAASPVHDPDVARFEALFVAGYGAGLESGTDDASEFLHWGFGARMGVRTATFPVYLGLMFQWYGGGTGHASNPYSGGLPYDTSSSSWQAGADIGVELGRAPVSVRLFGTIGASGFKWDCPSCLDPSLSVAGRTRHSLQFIGGGGTSVTGHVGAFAIGGELRFMGTDTQHTDLGTGWGVTGALVLGFATR